MAVVTQGAPPSKATAERLVRVKLNGVSAASLQSSPYALEELAAGFLISDGVISVDVPANIELTVDEDQAGFTVAIRSNDFFVPDTVMHYDKVRGSSGATLSAGVMTQLAAGRMNSDLYDPNKLVKHTLAACFNPDDLLAQMAVLCSQAPHRNAGECVHGCGVGALGEQDLLLIREDIGRHNAMDKTIGRAWLEHISLTDKVMFITGRISAEMALKAYRGGCSVLVSRKSVTDDAVDRGQKLGLTLVSHCRDGNLHVLTHPERICGCDACAV